ncbi:hypothetical protein Acsp04_52830 [Actinomadura sp. NBRC 104425]|uniref:hypothetical protein n=1 Tax=Actinomadura sp. NBRC 104425 TaxID=3032204 RepID=UPI0024A38038|nr:hypothetical protein [Actinomadura sp. NBRC 104425]GLZ15048.1 hypothetical protein Acsp04_52830 [Actinomadura sp. NBRC 104425]
MGDVQIVLGKVQTRAEIVEQLGGSPQGGICPSGKTLNVLIYTDPDVGEARGYHDGWLAEEDEYGPVFEYTGHGQGDQTFEGPLGRGNLAILQHVDKGRALRLFKAVGKVPGTETKLQRYLGRFELDSIQPYVVRAAPNDKGEMRRVIVFRLRPVGEEFERRDEDAIPPAAETEAIAVAADVTTSAIVEPERNKKTKSSRSAAPKTVAERREAELADRFQAFMGAKGRKLKRFQIKVQGLTGTLLTDLYDEQAHVLYELKGASTREAVRMAIGQLLDYRRHVKPAAPQLAVLLPEEPHADLRALLESLGIALAYWDGKTFVGVPGLDASA